MSDNIKRYLLANKYTFYNSTIPTINIRYKIELLFENINDDINDIFDNCNIDNYTNIVDKILLDLNTVQSLINEINDNTLYIKLSELIYKYKCIKGDTYLINDVYKIRINDNTLMTYIILYIMFMIILFIYLMLLFGPNYK